MDNAVPNVTPDVTPGTTPPPAQFEVTVYQIAGDETLARNRIDGSGWDWSWAPWRREWMDDTPSKFAYRCLPLTIANQTGWWVYNPVGFTAVWGGRDEPGGVRILFDTDPATWGRWINDQFGRGIVTWNTPFLWRTKPAGSRLLVAGPANYFKHGIQPLTAVIESDWMNMSFTMNWKITAANTTIRFDRGEPLFQAIPLAGNLCADLESARVTYLKLTDDPPVAEAYHRWQEGRNAFHQKKASGEVRPDGWQKEYFQGRDVFGRAVASGHTTKVTPPEVEYPRGKA